MLASEMAGIMGEEHGGENVEEPFPEAARIVEDRIQSHIAQADRHLAVRHPDWAVEGIGETIYTYTLWILRWKGNDSMRSKPNRRPQVEEELEITRGTKGGIVEIYRYRNGGWRWKIRSLPASYRAPWEFGKY